MVREIQGKRKGEGLSVAIVLSRFNQSVTDRLLDGALKALTSSGVAEDGIDLVRVPGAFEIPLAASRLAKAGGYDAIVCLGAVIRGDTPHFEFIAQEVARGIGQVSREHGIPAVFGVLTTETVEQALARAGGEHGNKGFEAGITAIEMAGLLRSLKNISGGKEPRGQANKARVVGPRRRGRELALQALFQSDLLGDWSGSALEEFWRQSAANKDAKEFAQALFSGVAAELEQIDRAIAAASEHWRVDRLNRVDAGVLRLGTYELLFCPDRPVSSVINEAIEVARRFGSVDSSKFVNGVLDRVAADAGRKGGGEKRGVGKDG